MGLAYSTVGRLWTAARHFVLSCSACIKCCGHESPVSSGVAAGGALKVKGWVT